ncbi:MAG: type II secretion system F family protein [Gammaproteobacteria bacterium]|nr:type II secretion system F family protein [Gammaproteobacteria bacterium]
MTNQSIYIWKGLDYNGILINGDIEAENKKSAIKALEKNNCTVLFIKKGNDFFNKSRKLSSKSKLDFMQQLQLLLQANVPLSDALELIEKTTDITPIKNITFKLKEKIISGASFSDALNFFPDYFNTSFRRVILAGEQSGRLEMVLTQLIEDQEQALQIKSKIVKALFYPISVMCIATFISIGLLIFVIPQFSTIYSNFDAKLPTMTRCLISMSHYVAKQGIYYCVAIFMFFLFLNRTVFIKNKKRLLLSRLPFIESILMRHEIIQWCQLISMTLLSGIPLVDSLFIANQAITQPTLKRQMCQVSDAVIGGKSLFDALSLCHYFPARARTMIAIGENADALPHMIKKIAILYQLELNETLERLSKLLEPVIMLLVAGFVSGLIIAMYLPIFRMGSVI